VVVISQDHYVGDSNDKEYVMRAVKKSGPILQSVAFKDQFVEDDFRNTYAENFLYDFTPQLTLMRLSLE
jgi:hypothetical protein